MEFKLDGCILTAKSDAFKNDEFKQLFIENFIDNLKDYFRQDVSTAHSIPELIDKWDIAQIDFTLYFNLMSLACIF